MAKMVGMSRSLKIEWLNKTVDLVLEGKSEAEIKEELNQYLSFEIASPTNLRKTREILMNIWVRSNDNSGRIRKRALAIYKNGDDKRLISHWCMILLAYPVFSDIAALIGKLANIQGNFTLSWLKQNIFDLWGERTTLYHSIDKIIQTLKSMGVVENVGLGKYQVKQYLISGDDENLLIIQTIILLKNKAYCDLKELSEAPQMFPFKYMVKNELLHQSESFILSNFGGKIVVSCENIEEV